MSSVLSIVRRELQAYFVSPIAYTVIVIFLGIVGFGYLRGLVAFVSIPEFLMVEREINIRNFVFEQLTLWMSVGMMLCLPALSMRLLSEERKGGTAELLMTSPLTTAQLVIGKFIGTMVVLAMILLLTSPFIMFLAYKGQPEWAVVGTAYLAYLLYGGLILAIGLFASALTENQIVALLLTYAIYLPLWLIELLVGFAGAPWDDLFAGFAVGFGLRVISQGLLDAHFLLLFVGLIFIFLFLCAQVVDSSRWR